MTYDVVRHIGIIRCRRSNLRCRRSARIQMKWHQWRMATVTTCFNWNPSLQVRKLERSPGWLGFGDISTWSSAPVPLYRALALAVTSIFWVDFLSVLRSHFAPACIGVYKQLLSQSEKRFVRTHWLQEVLGLSEVLWVRTVLFVGKCESRFRRFKKGSRALATRAKAHHQNWQSLGYIAQRSNHWAKATNLTYQGVNHCVY